MNSSDLKRTRELPFSDPQSYKRLKMTYRFKAALFTNPVSSESRLIRTLPPSAKTNHLPKPINKPVQPSTSNSSHSITKSNLLKISQVNQETQHLAAEITSITRYIEELEARLQDQNDRLNDLGQTYSMIETEQQKTLKEYSEEHHILEESVQAKFMECDILENKISVLKDITDSLEVTHSTQISNIFNLQSHNMQISQEIANLLSEYENLESFYASELSKTRVLIQDTLELSEKNSKDDKTIASLLRCISEYRK